VKKISIANDVIVPLGASIADGASVGAGVLLVDQLTISDDVTIEHGVVFAGGGTQPTRILSGAHIGAGAVIGPGVEIGWGVHVLPGSVVLTSVPANAIVSGNPAQIIGYTKGFAGDAGQADFESAESSEKDVRTTELGVGGASLYQMPKVADMRGNLTVGELGGDFPFKPERYFIVFDVPSEELRGEHAHRVCEQFLICVRGSCHALLDDGTSRREVVLNRPDLGLHMPAMIWGTQYRYTRDAVLLVFASRSYEATDYIRTYDEFRQEIARTSS